MAPDPGYGAPVAFASTPSPTQEHAAPQALAELSAASGELAETTGVFLAARDRLNAVRQRWDAAVENVKAARERDGV